MATVNAVDLPSEFTGTMSTVTFNSGRVRNSFANPIPSSDASGTRYRMRGIYRGERVYWTATRVDTDASEYSTEEGFSVTEIFLVGTI